ncbi:MAG: rhodoquinone biosynthesis methyltransferase RquA [Gammaproteobacteria bacterium]|nr:rhodoquinone biosynthesis methyltransferase RquA [Gammaproteobacteria bacterium]
MNASEQAHVSAARVPAPSDVLPLDAPAIPDYLERHYAWAYLRPRNVRRLDRLAVLQTILFGNYRRLCDAARRALAPGPRHRVLQVGCAYGDLTPRLARDVAPGHLEVVDVAALQLEQLRRKLPEDDTTRLRHEDACDLAVPDGSFDRVLLFFLLHELPPESQRRALAEALRVCRPDGRVVIVDYARPPALHPLRWVLTPLFTRLEPFAKGFWGRAIAELLPEGFAGSVAPERRWFGGLYREVTLRP